MKTPVLMFALIALSTVSVPAETDGAKLNAEQLAAQMATKAPVLPAGVKTRGIQPSDVRTRSGTLSQDAYAKTRSAIDLATARAVRLNLGTAKPEAGGSGGGQATPAKAMEMACPVSAATEIAIRLQFNFNSDSFADPAASGLDLDKFATALKTFVNPQGATAVERVREQFLIEGHTCDLGDNAPNQALSEKRALAVREQLLTRGVPAEMLLVLGQGEKRPTAPNDSEANRAMNRRVVVAKVTGAAVAAK